jgi:hypothetical protein
MAFDLGESATAMPLRRHAPPLVLLLCLLALLATGCKREPQELAGATSEPAAAVRDLIGYLQRDDLAGFAKAAVPAEDYAALETAWREDRSRWPLTELPLEDRLVPMLQALSAPNAEANLQRSFERQFARQDADLRDAARSLGMFGVQYVKNEGQYTPEQRHHYTQVINALSEWGQEAPLGDPALARNTIKSLAAAARTAGIDSEQALREAGMDASLRKLSPFLAAAKAGFTRYGLPLDASLAGLRTGLVQQQGDLATVRIHYPLGEQEIDSQVKLERRGGRWYFSDYLAEAARARAGASATEAAPAPALPPEEAD